MTSDEVIDLKVKSRLLPNTSDLIISHMYLQRATNPAIAIPDPNHQLHYSLPHSLTTMSALNFHQFPGLQIDFQCLNWDEALSADISTFTFEEYFHPDFFVPEPRPGLRWTRRCIGHDSNEATILLAVVKDLDLSNA